MLLHEADILNAHGLFGGFCHVVHRQRGDRYSGECFHFHARFACGLGSGSDDHTRQGFVEGEVYIHFRKEERMT